MEVDYKGFHLHIEKAEEEEEGLVLESKVEEVEREVGEVGTLSIYVIISDFFLFHFQKKNVSIHHLLPFALHFSACILDGSMW